MISLTTKLHFPQLRAVPLVGRGALFRYERMIKGRWVPCNHSRAAGIVGVVNRRGGVCII